MNEQMIPGKDGFLIDGKAYAFKEIKNMDFENLKVIASFCSTEVELKTLDFHADNIQFKIYIENLINRLYE